MASPHSRAHTLIEVVSVVAVLGVLAALGWGGWLAVRGEIEGQNSQLTLTQLAASAHQYEQSRGFFPSTPQELEGLEPSLRYTTAGSGSVEEVAVAVSPSGELLGLAVLDHRTCTTIKVAAGLSGGVVGTASFPASGDTACTGSAALDQDGEQW